MAVVATKTNAIPSSWSGRFHDSQHTNRSTAQGPKYPKVVREFEITDIAEGADGTLYGVDREGRPAAVDPADGRVKWRLRERLSAHGTPAVVHGGIVVYSAVAEGPKRRPFAFAVDAGGRRLWRTWLAPGMADLKRDRVDAGSPTVGPDGTVFVSANQVNGEDGAGSVVALDSVTGGIKWTYSVRGGRFRDPLVSEDGVVYGADDLGLALHILSSSGKLVMRVPVGCDNADPAIGSDGTVYLLSSQALGMMSKNTLMAIGPDGRTMWTCPTDAQGAVAIGPDGTIYCAGEGLHAISPQGRELWAIPLAEFPYAVAVDAAGVVYVRDGADLLAVRPDGSVRWRASGSGRGEPRIGQRGTIYAGNIAVSAGE
jgi:outer membrane protein assembly factor BamB